MLIGLPALAVSPTQCKAACEKDFRPKCEKECRAHAKKILDLCLNQVCDEAVKKCSSLCDNPPKPLK